MTVRPTDAPQEFGIAVFARAPVAGQAKTRLIPALGAAGAAALQRWLLGHTLATATAAGLGPVTLWCAGDTTHADFLASRKTHGTPLQAQPDGDLGARMLAALHASAATAGTLLIGTDCPALTVAHLHEAARRLRSHDAVVLPAEDGGYVLLGLRRPEPLVFEDIAWGTDKVMAQTRERLCSARLRWDEPEMLWDVDRPADLERLFAAFPAARDAVAVGPAR